MLVPYQERATPADLDALTRFWRWERTVLEQLPTVLASGAVRIVFQPIFDIRGDVPLLRAYEALARFPDAPEIPTGLWFNIADRLDLGSELEMLAARQAIARADWLPEDALLFVNASPKVIPLILDSVPKRWTKRLVFDLPSHAIFETGWSWVAAQLSSRRIKFAWYADETGPGISMKGGCPEYLRHDVSGQSSDPARLERLNQRLQNWESGRSHLIAHRVDRINDLPALRDIGFHWAQGNGLGRPTEI